MNKTEIHDVARDILGQTLASYKFSDAEVRFDEDFDGSSIIRVTALHDNDFVPTIALSQSLHRLRTELLKRGEERFVFVDSKSLQPNQAEDDQP